jgi:hypothetical protein
LIAKSIRQRLGRIPDRKAACPTYAHQQALMRTIDAFLQRAS